MDKNVTAKANKAMDRVWQVAVLIIGTFCGFLFTQGLDHEKRLTSMEARLDPVIRQIISDEISRCVPPAWFKAQVDQMKKDMDGLKAHVIQLRQDIRDLKRP